jgi:hypothetical protein
MFSISEEVKFTYRGSSMSESRPSRDTTLLSETRDKKTISLFHLEAI